MTDTDELIKRLRTEANGMEICKMEVWPEITREAADALESLQRKVAALEAQIESSRNQEPVAWVFRDIDGTVIETFYQSSCPIPNCIPLYRHAAPAVPDGCQLVPKEARPVLTYCNLIFDEKLLQDEEWLADAVNATSTKDETFGEPLFRLDIALNLTGQAALDWYKTNMLAAAPKGEVK